MILEIAQIDVKPGMEAEFEAGVAKAAPVFKRRSRSLRLPDYAPCNRAVVSHAAP